MKGYNFFFLLLHKVRQNAFCSVFLSPKCQLQKKKKKSPWCYVTTSTLSTTKLCNVSWMLAHQSSKRWRIPASKFIFHYKMQFIKLDRENSPFQLPQHGQKLGSVGWYTEKANQDMLEPTNSIYIWSNLFLCWLVECSRRSQNAVKSTK